jgi:transposase InsO family protein
LLLRVFLITGKEQHGQILGTPLSDRLPPDAKATTRSTCPAQSRRPCPVEILRLHPVEAAIRCKCTDRSPYIAKDTQIFARQLCLKPCFTPVQSPQSNGISEAFVKTLKRDYVQVTPLPDARTVLGLIGAWIEDYNENYPHSGLKMRSPRKFIAAQTATA